MSLFVLPTTQADLVQLQNGLQFSSNAAQAAAQSAAINAPGSSTSVFTTAASILNANISLSQVAMATTALMEGGTIAVGDTTTSNTLTFLTTQFLPGQVANAVANNLNPTVYAAEALGLALASNASFNTNYVSLNVSQFVQAVSTATGVNATAIQGFVNNWTAFYTANPSARPGLTVTQAAYGAAFGDAVGVALLNDTTANLHTVFSTTSANNFSPNAVTGLVANALIDVATGQYQTGQALGSLAPHTPLQGEAGGGTGGVFLTQNIDSPTAGFSTSPNGTPVLNGFTATSANAIFTAQPFVTQFGLGNNTLNTGDNLQTSGAATGTTTLNYTTATAAAANPSFATGVAMNGVNTANITNAAPGIVAGFQGASIDGLKVVNSTGSVFTVQTGAPGQGTNTALTDLGVKAYGGANGDAVLASFVAASALSGSTDSINVTTTGKLGGAGALIGTADSIAVAADAGTNGYENWNLTVNNDSFLQLGQGNATAAGAGVGSGSSIVLKGAGNVELSAFTTGDWASLKSIDATAVTGKVVITGHLDNAGGDGFGTSTVGDPSLGAGLAGLLDGNTSLTSFKGSTTNSNQLDVSGFTKAQVAALTATGNTAAGIVNTINVSMAVATTTSATTFAGITGFQNLGIGADEDEVKGTINMANLPGSINTITFWDEQATKGGLLTINNVTAPTFTVDGHDQWSGGGLTVGAVGPNPGLTDVLNVTLGTNLKGFAANPANTAIDLGPLTVFGEETVNLASNNPTAAKINTTGDIHFTPTSGALLQVFNITGNDGVHVTDTDGKAGVLMIDGPGVLQVNDTNTGILHLDAKAFVSTNAGAINAATSGGLIMDGADTFFVGKSGAVITGSATAHNQIIGGHGNDIITGGTGGDTIWTNGGADTVNLGAPGAHDVINISGFPSLHSIVNNNNTANDGWWGLTPGAASQNIFGKAGDNPIFNIGTVTGGTSADITTIKNFDAGNGANTDQLVFFGAFGNTTNAWTTTPVGVNSLGGTAWGIAAGFFTSFPAAGDAQLGTSTNLGPAADLQLVTANLPDAAALAANLHSVSIYTIPTALAPNQDFHFLFAYNSGDGLNIADVDFVNTTKAGQTSTANLNIYASDMVHLTGVTVAELTGHNVQFA